MEVSRKKVRGCYGSRILTRSKGDPRPAAVTQPLCWSRKVKAGSPYDLSRHPGEASWNSGRRVEQERVGKSGLGSNMLARRSSTPSAPWRPTLSRGRALADVVTGATSPPLCFVSISASTGGTLDSGLCSRLRRVMPPALMAPLPPLPPGRAQNRGATGHSAPAPHPKRRGYRPWRATSGVTPGAPGPTR